MSDENMDGEFMAVAEEYDEFEGDVTVHKVVNGQSQKVSISEILPTRVRIQQCTHYPAFIIIFLDPKEGT